nr:chordin [Ciona intestinalis]|eukprot:XP_026690585.1 chordin [Ciona intestinalis]
MNRDVTGKRLRHSGGTLSRDLVDFTISKSHFEQEQMMMTSCYYVTVVFIAMTSGICAGFLQIHPAEEALPSNNPRGCVFGRQFHVIGSSWHPNLGRPFGIMYCVTCQCVKETTGRFKPDGQPKEVTRVTCHDVRKDCPHVTCKGAKVPRGGCCKVCPDDTDTIVTSAEEFSSKNGDVPLPLDITEEKSINHDDSKAGVDEKTKSYVALLTSNDGGPLLRATFNLHRDNLHFTIQYLRSTKPTIIEMLTNDDVTIYTHVTEMSPKPGQPIVCGVWRNLPKHVVSSLDKRLLTLRAVFVQTGANMTSQGQIIRHRALSRETFSSILSTTPLDGASGAIAMITLGRHRFNKLHFAILLRRSSVTSQPTTITVRLLNNQNRTLRSTEKTLQPSSNELADVWSTNSEILRRLGDGSLHIQMVARTTGSRDKQSYIGSVRAKTTCDLLQAVLSGSDCSLPASTGAAGSAILNINSDNTVSYKVALVGISSRVTSISLLGDYRKKRTRVVADLTPQFVNGKAQGRLENLNGKEIHLLLSNRVRVAVETEQSNSGELGGHVTSLLYGGHQARYKGLPIPLAGSLVRPPVFTGAAGHVWLELNEECHLYYEIVVSGLSKERDTTLAAHLHGLAEIAETETGHKQLLKGFYGKEARGILRELSSEIYEHLNQGNAFVQIATKSNPGGEIRGRVHIPNTCSRTIVNKANHKQDTSDTDQNSLSVPSSDVTTSRVTDLDAVVHDGVIPTYTERRLELDPSACYVIDEWKPHGSEWAPDYDPKCTICVCESGSSLCDPVYCPPLECGRPVATEGSCCPVCNDGFGEIPTKHDDGASIGSLFGSPFTQLDQKEDEKEKEKEGCYYGGDGQIHAIGSWWHPYFKRFGHVSCVNCTCRPDGEIVCGKITCPPVTCSNPIKQNPRDCCKTCPEVTRHELRHESRDHRMQDDSVSRMCQFGRELRAPGEKWTLGYLGRRNLECIECECATHGVKHKCRKNCPAVSHECSRVERNVSGCCPWRCADRQRSTERFPFS